MEPGSHSAEENHRQLVEDPSSRAAHHYSSKQRELALRLLREGIATLGRSYLFYVLAVIAFGLITLLPPQLFRYFTEVTRELSSINAQEFLWRIALFGGSVAVVLFLSSVANTLIHEWLRLRLEAELRRRVLQRLQDIPLNVLDGAQRGDWMTRMTGDLGLAETFFTEDIPSQIRQAAILLGAGSLFFYHSGSLALVPLAAAAFLAWVNVRVQRRLSPMLSELRQLHGGVFQILLESLEGIRTIRSHGVEPFVQRRFESRLSEITQKSMGVVRYLGALMGGTELAGQILVTACLTVAAWALSAGRMTIEEVLIYPFFIGLFYGSAQSLAAAAYDWNRFFVEGGRLGEILYDPRSIGPQIRYSSRGALAASETLEVSGVEVGHHARLAGPFQFSVTRGELVGVIGPSGCGKSTFLEVLAGLRPALAGIAVLKDGEGRALWQSPAGGPARLPIGPCAYVEQHPYIFEGTLRENLTFGNPDRLSDAVIWECLERASLDRFARYYGGLDHKLRDRGRNLSEGERYRIALCRALLLRRPFLLLDEPFAALDEASVNVVITTLEAEKMRAGIVVVTHYLPEALALDGALNFEQLSSRYQRSEFGKINELGSADFPREEGMVASTASTLGVLATMNNHINRQ